MNLNDAIKGMKQPQNFYHQADCSVYYILYTSLGKDVGDAYYTALGSLPERVDAAALDCFLNGDATSYHAKVLRAAMKRFKHEGFINETIPALSVRELI